MQSILSQSQKSQIFVDVYNGIPVIWKQAHQGSKSSQLLLAEYEFLSKIKINGIRKTIATGLYNNKESFAYQYIPGISLKAYLNKQLPDYNEFFEISLQLVKILKHLHENGFYHFQINSNNIIIDPHSLEIHLIDFCNVSSGSFNGKQDLLSWGNELEYISPEQTGRERSISDGRSDLYSLGIVFYELLAKSTPFYEFKDLDLIHSHLVKKPLLLNKVLHDIPIALASIIAKLLSKNPRDRYQTVSGLEYDLTRCQNYYATGLKNDPIDLGIQDIPLQLSIDSRIIGHEKELEKLKILVEKIIQNEFQLLLVSGKTGTGKSKLNNYLEGLLEAYGGVSLFGQFTSQAMQTPLQAMTGALDNLASRILSLPDDKIKDWKTKLQLAVEDIGGLLVKMVPKFQLILGIQKDIIELTGSQAESRIHFLFQRILEVIASPQHAILLFLDDIQLADESSLKSILTILADKQIGNLLLVCTMNTDDEPNEKLKIFLKEIQEAPVIKSEIELQNLSVEQIKIFLEDSLVLKEAHTISNLLFHKTLGNPYYIIQLMDELYREKSIRYDTEQKEWIIDQDKLIALPPAQNAIEYFCKKIEDVSPYCRKLLNIIACYSDIASLSFLQKMMSPEDQTISEEINNLIEQRILQSNDDEFCKFVNDKVKMYIYDQLTIEEKTKYHHAIAQDLLQKNKLANAVNVFELSKHFSESKSNISESDRFQVIEIHSLAGKNSKDSGAFHAAYHFYKEAVELVKPEDWNGKYQSLIDLYSAAADSANILGEFSFSEKSLANVFSHTRDSIDAVYANEIKLNHFAETHNFTDGISHLLMTLEQIGYPLKRNPNQFIILAEYIGVKRLLMGKSTLDLLDLPLMTDEKAKAFLKLTVLSTASVFGAAPDILPLIIFKQTKLSLKYGNSSYSPYAYCFYGYSTMVFMNDISKGYDFASMALKLVDRLQAENVRAKVMMVFYGFIAYWKDSLVSCIAPLKDAYLIGRKTGDLLYSAFSLSFHNQIKLHSGYPLDQLISEMESDNLIIKNMGQELVYTISNCQWQFAYNLIHEVTDPLVFESTGFQEKDHIDLLDKMGDRASKFEIYCYKLQAAFLFNQYKEAIQFSDQAAAFEEETTSRQIPYPSYLMFTAAAQIVYSRQISPKEKEPHLKKARKKIKLLLSFAKHAKQNYINKCTFLEALLAETNGTFDLADKLYVQAIKESEQSGFINEEAIIREHYAYYLDQHHGTEFGDMMLQKAYESYRLWGATAKCKKLLQEYPKVLNSQMISSQGSSIGAFQTVFDLNTIISANQILSSENTFDGLVSKIIELIQSNASITNLIIFLRRRNSDLNPVAISTMDNAKLLSRKEALGLEYPRVIINQVARSQKELVSKNLQKDRNYNFDAYIKNRNPKSICCLPIRTKDHFLGVIYFENNIHEDAFDRKRIDYFATIIAQLAISLENVELYEEMEDKINERTAELKVKNQELSEEKNKVESLLLNILPREIADELKATGQSKATKFHNVSVVFSDVKNFTLLADQFSHEELVDELDIIFKQFDEIIEKHGLEKIKTIGDAYMAAGGLPKNNKATAKDVVYAALEMQSYIKQRVEQRRKDGKKFFEFRAGIHSGPVIAGVVGSKKFQYDIWGSTVNLAARMEQNSEIGQVNISEATYVQVKDDFNCTYRGKLDAKNIGEVAMYFVDQN